MNQRSIERWAAWARRLATPAALVFWVALAARLSHALAYSASPYFDHPVFDAMIYHRQALQIAEGLGHPDDVFWQVPGYAYFLGFLRTLFDGFFAVRIAHAVLGALSCALLVPIGRRLFDARVGVAAGLAAALWGPLIFFEGELLPPALGIFLEMVAVLATLRAREARGKLAEPAWSTGAGVAAGLATVTIGQFLLVVPLLAVFVRRRAPWLLLGAALAIAPVTVRNLLRGGQPVLLSYNTGPNLYIGNNPDYDRTMAIRPGKDWDALMDESRAAGAQGEAAESRWFQGRVFDWAVRDPVAFARLQVRKLGLLVGGDEVPREHEVYPIREISPLLRALMWKVPFLAFPFGLALPLAVLGMAVSWRRTWLLTAGVCGYALGVVAFFVAARHRLPLVPFLALFAAEGVRWLAAAVSARRVGALACAATLMVALFVLSNHGHGPMARQMDPDAEFSLADLLAADGRFEEAAGHLENALRRKSGYVDAWFLLGKVRSSQARWDEATAAFEQAMQIDPKDVRPVNNLAIIKAEAGRLQEAIPLFERAVELAPQDPMPRRNLALARDALAR